MRLLLVSSCVELNQLEVLVAQVEAAVASGRPIHQNGTLCLGTDFGSAIVAPGPQ